MGARVIAMLNAVRVARDYDLPYYVGWTTHGRTREEVRDPSFIFHPDYIKDQFFRRYDHVRDLRQSDRCQSQSNKGPNTRRKKGPLRLMFCSALARVLVI